MGRWGLGNLDSDKASEFLDFIIKMCVNTAERSFAEDNLNREPYDFLDRIGETRAMPALDVLMTLCQHYGAVPDIKDEVNKQTFQKWKQFYLKLFDEDTSMYAGEPKEDRRAIIAQTFDTLIDLCDDE